MQAVPVVVVERPDGVHVHAKKVLGAALRGQEGVVAAQLGDLCREKNNKIIKLSTENVF